MGPVSQTFHCSDSCGTLKNPHHCSKRVGDVDLDDVPTFLGLGGLSVRSDLNNTCRDDITILLQVLYWLPLNSVCIR